MHGMLISAEDHTTYAPVDDALRWYALLVQSGQERKVCIWLRRRQYEPYWARYMAQVKLNRHRRAKRWCSIFPGYLFLPDTKPINWSLVEDAEHVHGFMSSASGDLIVIPHKGKQGLEQIRNIEIKERKDAKDIPFKVGQIVRIGRLDINAKILAIASPSQISLEGPMFGSVRRIVLPITELEAV